MRLYTIQHVNALETLIATGELVSSREHALPIFQRYYDWIVKAATEKGLPMEGYPIWACMDKKLLFQLFSSNHFHERDRVCITFVVPEHLQLPSSYYRWEYVLSGMFIHYTKEEEDEFYSRVPWLEEEYEDVEYKDLPFDIPLEQSWYRIFELDKFPNEPIQTITPKLTVDMVKRIEVLTDNPYYDTFYDQL